MSRTLLVQDWTFHTAYGRGDNKQDYGPADLGGVDLLDFLEQRLTGREINDEEKQRWTAVEDIKRVGERALLVSASAGAYNEPGSLVDVESGERAFQIGQNHAATSTTRTLYVVPDQGLHAVAFYERSTGRGTSGLDLLREMMSIWRDEGHKITWARQWLEETEAWLKAAQLKAVQVRRYSDEASTGGPTAEDIGEFTFGAKAAKNHYLPHRTLEQILDRPGAAYELIGHGLTEEDGDRVFIDLVSGGRQKTYALDRGTLPKAQLAIDDLDDDEFVETAIKMASDTVFPRLGIQWRPAWGQSAAS